MYRNVQFHACLLLLCKHMLLMKPTHTWVGGGRLTVPGGCHRWSLSLRVNDTTQINTAGCRDLTSVLLKATPQLKEQTPRDMSSCAFSSENASMPNTMGGLDPGAKKGHYLKKLVKPRRVLPNRLPPGVSPALGAWLWCPCPVGRWWADGGGRRLELHSSKIVPG